MHRSKLVSVVSLMALALLVGQPAEAQDGPVLHERIDDDIAEDLDLAATNPTGELPAAIETPSGVVTPPDVHTTPDPRRTYYKEQSPTFRPDRDTRRPNVERYDDPFSPTLTPFKRMYAFDAVREDYSLYVRDTTWQPVEPTEELLESDDRFFGDMSVQLRAGEYVRIPSVGPGTRLIKLVTSPEQDVRVFQDGAENWFVLSDTSARVRMVSELAISRDAFASEYADVSWSELPVVPIQPGLHRSAYDQVRSAIGISRSMSPREVVTKMVAYFRSFAPSTDPPTGDGDIYLDLALSKKGVCRHRAFAFLVTALNVGIPARLVHNEAHAWVEVQDDRLWHRIDLGGAALNLDEEPHLDRPPHVPPPDQFEWPSGRDSGSDLAHESREEQLRDEADNGGVPDPDAPPVFDPTAEPDPNAPNPAAEMPRTELTLDDVDRHIFRGKPMRLRGTARSEGKPCAHLRVDVMLLIDDGATQRRLGSLSTDERGVYAGAVVVPPNVAIGDHDLVVATPGAGKCGPGQAE